MTCKISVETHKALHVPNAPGECWEFESVKVVDHDNANDKKWFANHLHWAFRNQRRVTIYPESN